MGIRIVQLGSQRQKGEGVRIGTVWRPPRGVPKAEFAKRDFYDTWLPELSPSEELVKRGQDAASEREWSSFVKAYRREMARPEAQHLLGLLATLSQTSALAVGCYCEDERRCHRSVLREVLREHGAKIVE